MSIETDQIAQLQADLAAVWERKRELDQVEIQLRAENAKLEAIAKAAAAFIDQQGMLAQGDIAGDQFNALERALQAAGR